MYGGSFKKGGGGTHPQNYCKCKMMETVWQKLQKDGKCHQMMAIWHPWFPTFKSKPKGAVMCHQL